MLIQIRYNRSTKKLRAWCKDPTSFGSMLCKEDEEIVIIEADPTYSIRDYSFDEDTATLVWNGHDSLKLGG